MRNVLFLTVLMISTISVYTLIYVDQANAQEEKSEKLTQEAPILIALDTLKLNDLSQLPEPVKVKTIINAKTFTGYNGKTYTLSTLDTNLEHGDYASQAKKFLDDTVKDQTIILYETNNPKIGRQNRMGHYLVHAIRETDHAWIQASLLANGFARLRTSEFNAEQADKLRSYEHSARSQNRGLWGNDNYKILTPETANDQIGSFNIVEGTIKKVAITKNNIYLNFGNNWKTDFTIGITPKIRRMLAKDNVPVQNWTNKKIRIHGWIRLYNGPYIEMTHKEQIEIIENDEQEQEQPISSD